MKKDFFRRLICLLMVCVLCFVMGTGAFATELQVNNAAMASSFSKGIEAASSNRDLLYSEGKSVKVSTTVTITTEETNKNAEFYVGVIGNTGVSYYVTMTAANGTQYGAVVKGDNGLVKIATMTSAKAGTYKFYFYTASGVTTYGSAMAQIYG